MGSKSLALSFHVQAECKTSRARAGIMKLPHYEVKTPVFMPVGTQVSGSMHLVSNVLLQIIIIIYKTIVFFSITNHTLPLLSRVQ